MIVSFKENYKKKNCNEIPEEISILQESLDIIEGLNIPEHSKKTMIQIEMERYERNASIMKESLEADQVVIGSAQKLLSNIKFLEEIQNDNIFYSNALEVFSKIEKVIRIYEARTEIIKPIMSNFLDVKNKIFKLLNSSQEDLYSVQSKQSMYYKDIFNLADCASLVVGIHHAILGNPDVAQKIYFSVISDDSRNDEIKNNVVDLKNGE